MAQTLTRQRRQKFLEIMDEYAVFIRKLSGNDVDEWRKKMADELVNASLSRTERATDDEAGEYNTELFRGDWREYPERLHKIAETLRDVWKFTLPPKPAKKEGKGQYSFYIQAMDAIKQSCAEFGADVLVKVHTDWKAGFKNGLAPYTVAQPTSLVNMCAAKARELREGSPEQKQTGRVQANLERDL